MNIMLHNWRLNLLFLQGLLKPRIFHEKKLMDKEEPKAPANFLKSGESPRYPFYLFVALSYSSKLQMNFFRRPASYRRNMGLLTFVEDLLAAIGSMVSTMGSSVRSGISASSSSEICLIRQNLKPICCLNFQSCHFHDRANDILILLRCSIDFFSRVICFKQFILFLSYPMLHH